jgi:preprotein translocase subunit SecB
MQKHDCILLTNLFLKESKISLANQEEAEKGGNLNLFISAENILNQDSIFSLDLNFEVQAENEFSNSTLFVISCTFSSSFTVKESSSPLSQDDEAKLATICFSQAYLSIREYIADTLRRMNLLSPISSLPLIIDFDNKYIKINSNCE